MQSRRYANADRTSVPTHRRTAAPPHSDHDNALCTGIEPTCNRIEIARFERAQAAPWQIAGFCATFANSRAISR